jgi:dipeptidyl aminopeptidase/acylaminoacyl peptidase
VSSAQTPEFYEALRKKGVKAEFMMIPGIDHSYVGATAESTRGAALNALDRTIQFIDATIDDQ